MTAMNSNPMQASLNAYQERVEHALKEMEAEQIVSRIWEHDHTVWKDDPKEISNRLGWLHSFTEMRGSLARLDALVEEVREAGYIQALVLGMGGSSLAPELFGLTFGGKKGFLDLRILDSTSPGAVLSYAREYVPEKTLLIVSTKSGTTVETLSFFKYFYNWMSAAIGPEMAGEHFVAITDPGSRLVDLAEQYDFREVFLNDPNIGGRYSVLSFFGLVPAALVGVDVSRMLDNAQAMAEACGASVEAGENPGARLGVILGELALAGRNKLTLLTSPQIARFGDWVEQLIAESTGKSGTGILPVVGEPLGDPQLYAGDRLFVHLRLEGDTSDDEALADLEEAGQPVVRLTLENGYDLGGQFFLWELATAVAGYRLGIHPFNQPNVESAKVRAKEMVSSYQETGELPTESPALVVDSIGVYGEVQAEALGDVWSGLLENANPGDYLALQAFLQPTEATSDALQFLRTRLRELLHLATTVGYGPRFLHSTGQLHKGDAGNGLFVQLTSDEPEDARIPDQAGEDESSLSFGVLKLAQALGDRKALLDADRRVIRFHLSGDPASDIRILAHQLI